VNETGSRDERIRESHRDASRTQVAHDLAGALGDGSVEAACVEGTQERTRAIFLAAPDASFDLGNRNRRARERTDTTSFIR